MEKDEERRVTMVVRVGMHYCDERAGVVEYVKGLHGVESASAKNNKELTVSGRVDPCYLCRSLEERFGRKVVLFSLVTDVDGERQPQKAKEGIKEQDVKMKPKEKTTSTSELVRPTAVLKMRLHCKGCMKKVRGKLLRFPGVRAVTTDLETGLVTIEGRVDVKSIVMYLQRLLRQTVQVVVGGGEENVGASAAGEGVKTPKANSNGGGGNSGANRESKEAETRPEVKDRKKKEAVEKEKEKDLRTPEKQPVAEEEEEEEVLISVVVKRKKDQDRHRGGGGGGGGGGSDRKGREERNSVGATLKIIRQQEPQEEDHHHQAGAYAPYGYNIEMAYAPQLFSDENPNACSIM